MPLQHISNRVLLCMNRPPRQHTEALLAKLRARIPGLVLRTTFITGFPGETKADHRELVDFVREQRFERMGVFAYSPEQGSEDPHPPSFSLLEFCHLHSRPPPLAKPFPFLRVLGQLPRPSTPSR